MYRVLVVDDEKYIRKSIINRVNWERCQTEVVGEASDGEEGYRLVMQCRPNIIITDIRMPGMDGLALAKKVEEDYPQIRVIIISAYNDFEYARTAISYGVREYLLKPVDEGEMEAVLLRLVKEMEQRLPGNRGDGVTAEGGQQIGYDVLDEIRDYVLKHYMEDLSVAQIADCYHLNATYLSTIFRERNQITLSGYLEGVRMEKAKYFLKETNSNVTETAFAVGYSDSNYFTKVFKKYTGMTPSQWRKREEGR